MTTNHTGGDTTGPSEKKQPVLPESIACKIITDTEEVPRSRKQWTRARRSILEVRDDGLFYLDTFVGYEEVEEAVIRIYKSAFFFEYGILTVTHNGRKDHFGIKYDDFWKSDLPLDIERIEEETPFILFRRALIVVILIYIFWEIVKH